MTRSLPMLRQALLVLALFALMLLIVAKLDPPKQSDILGPFHAIDGDTLASDAGRLRLLGIDAPELDQTCTGGDGVDWHCGQKARQALIELVGADNVECKGAARDRYHRLLVDCQVGTTSINAALVAQGMAIASGAYEQEQSEARKAGRGIWSGRFETPHQWRAEHGMTRKPDPFGTAWDWLTRVFNR